MNCLGRTSSPVVLSVALLGLAPLVGGAQESTPTAGGLADGVTVVAAGLTNPRGMDWDADGTLYIALAGTGGSTAGTPEFSPPFGPLSGGPTAAVARIGADGCPVAVATDLPSYVDGTGAAIGAADVAFLGEQLYALVAGGTALYGNPDWTNGVYRVNDDGTTELVADYAAWLRENPPEVAGWTQPPDIPAEFPNPGNPFAMVAGDDRLWVVDAVNGLILTVAPDDGTIERAADLSAGHPVPTGIALAPEGGVYVGTLTPVPYPDGGAKVVHVAPDGTVRDVWTGLTTVTGVAVGPDGTLYAAEMSTGNIAEEPFLVPASGRVVRQTGADEAEPVVSALMLPVALDVGPDEALYVALSAIGADAGTGMIARVDATGAPSDATAAMPPSCWPTTAGTPPALVHAVGVAPPR